MLLFAALLTACGSNDDADPTAAPVEPTTEATATEVEPTIASTTVATPAMATPMAQASPVGIASPSAIATPVASPEGLATPASVVVPVVDTATDDSASTPVATRTLAGTVILPGTINQDFVVSDDGCVGLGEFSSMQAGRQVVVRDETGSIIGVAELAAGDAADACSWTFLVEVPESTFYAVTIPMVTERVYTHAEIIHSESEIEISLP